MENSEKMIEKCDELTKKFEEKNISFLDLLIEIKMDTKIMLNLEKKIKKSTNNETLYVEFNFFSAKSIENLCERNDSKIFDFFFPDKILKQNDSKLPYLINKEKFLSEINFERCFRIALENKNEEIATKLLLLCNLFRKINHNEHGDYHNQDFISNFLSLIKFFSKSNSNRKLDTKPIRDLADDFWSPWKKAFYIGFSYYSSMRIT
ncbi:hypothetical protein BpHYR1_033506 [Brachionus plicatilis]|uniref:Uncharacterized protein n=1 Tax=Brachionus plicatilis TaxID=10195 RepID=A0A3M7QXS8_BRAPC|nr:hypothetical protein BpHYR1_033506 [Brachionus plicatilis]